MATKVDFSSGAIPVARPSISPTSRMFGSGSASTFGSFLGKAITHAFVPWYHEEQRQDELSQRDRDFNASQAEIARKFSADEAQKNRDFQERMSNTAYQRAVRDMQLAGINPMIAFSSGVSGASTPSGSVGSSFSASSNSKYAKADKADNEVLSQLLRIVAGLIFIGGK